METFEVDLDAETIWINGVWRTRDELVEEIGAKLRSGDYQIAQLSQALENLNLSIEQGRDLNVRLSREMFEALEAAAQDLGRSSSAIVRQLLDDWLFPKDSDEMSAEAPADEAGTEAEAAEEPAEEASEAAEYGEADAYEGDAGAEFAEEPAEGEVYEGEEAAPEEGAEAADEPAEPFSDEPSSDPTPTSDEDEVMDGEEAEAPEV